MNQKLIIYDLYDLFDIKVWMLYIAIFLNFFSTLLIFPVYQLGIERYSSSFFINDKWFQDITMYLTFNVVVILGNMLPKYVRKPGPKWLIVLVIARVVCMLIFYTFCNFEPTKRNHIPVLIKNDYVYWGVSALFTFLYGHFASLLLMYIPK